jgi:murein DD-endopeptidase MepM/ murein hydrolase activator NlpD
MMQKLTFYAVWSLWLLVLSGCATPPNYAPVVHKNDAYTTEYGKATGLNRQQKNKLKQQSLNSANEVKSVQTIPEAAGMSNRKAEKKIAPPDSAQPTNQTPKTNTKTLNKSYPVKKSVNSVTKKQIEATDVRSIESKIKPVRPNDKKMTGSQLTANTEINPRNTLTKQTIKPVKPSAKNVVLAKADEQKKIVENKKLSISNNNKKVLKLNFQWPLKGKVAKSFSQTDNKGIDIAGKSGEHVRASEAGKAVYSGHGMLGLGNLIVIKHNDSYLSAYANNNKLLVKEGQWVEKGQRIAQMGALKAKQPILHFEIRKNGKPINPLALLP